jgi:hypothetical protein
MSPEQFDMALQRMTRRISEAADGTGEAQNAIKELGLEAVALERMGPEKAFIAIANAMAAIPLASDRLRVAFKFFDSEGAKLATTLAGGEGSLLDARRQLQQMGAILSHPDVELVKEYSKAANDAAEASAAFWRNQSLEAAPATTLWQRAKTEFFKQQRAMGPTSPLGAALNAPGALAELARLPTPGGPQRALASQLGRSRITAANRMRRDEEARASGRANFNKRLDKQWFDQQSMVLDFLAADITRELAAGKPNVFVPTFQADLRQRFRTSEAPSGQTGGPQTQASFQAAMRGFGDKEIELQTTMAKELTRIRKLEEKEPDIALKPADLLGYDPYNP